MNISIWSMVVMFASFVLCVSKVCCEGKKSKKQEAENGTRQSIKRQICCLYCQASYTSTDSMLQHLKEDHGVTMSAEIDDRSQEQHTKLTRTAEHVKLWCPYHLPHDTMSCQTYYHNTTQMAQHLREVHGAGKATETDDGSTQTPHHAHAQMLKHREDNHAAEQTANESSDLFSSGDESGDEFTEDRRFVCPHAACRKHYPDILQMYRHLRDYHKEPRMRNAIIETTTG